MPPGELSLVRPAHESPTPEDPGAGSGSPREKRPGRLIGDVIVELGFASRERVEQAVEVARARGKLPGQLLVEQGVLRHDQLARVVAERYDLDYIDLSTYELDMGAVNLLDMDAIRRYQAVPVGFLDDGTLLLAMADPTNVLTIDDVAMITDRKVRAACASVEDVHILITRLSRVEQAVEEIIEDEAAPEAEPSPLLVEETDADSPVI